MDTVHDDLHAMQQMIAASADLQRVVRSPVLRRQEQAEALMALGRRAGFAELTIRFLGVLASARRLFALPDIIEVYRVLLADHRGITQVEVAVASPLSEAQERALREAFSTVVGGGEVDMKVDIDPELIGGLVARIGSRMIDTSVRSRLARMRTAMQEAN